MSDEFTKSGRPFDTVNGWINIPESILPHMPVSIAGEIRRSSPTEGHFSFMRILRSAHVCNGLGDLWVAIYGRVAETDEEGIPDHRLVAGTADFSRMCEAVIAFRDKGLRVQPDEY